MVFHGESGKKRNPPVSLLFLHPGLSLWRGVAIFRAETKDPAVASVQDLLKNLHDAFRELDQQTALRPELKPAAMKLFTELVRLEAALKKTPEPAGKPDPADARRLEQAKSILAEKNLGNLLNFAVDSLIRMTGADRGFLASLSETGDLELYAARSISTGEIEDPNSQISKTILRETLSSGTIHQVSPEKSGFQYQSIRHLQIGSVLCFPVSDEGLSVAILYLDRQTGDFDASKNQDLMEFCQMLAPKIRLLKQMNDLVKKTEQQAEPEFRFPGVSGQSGVFRDILKMTRRVSATDATVLVLGESGTGKELIARAIHDHSKRKTGPFVAVNCSAIPADLIESELFGYEKGAFTGANSRKPGKFELADGGTLFLDEIGDLNADLQSKFLRVLQSRLLDVLGGKSPVPIDVRVIAATNRNLKLMTESQKFREDLYYRLNVISIHLPPLRNRRADIPALVHHFLAKIGTRNGLGPCQITDEALESLLGYKWPGNIRELENVIERGLILCEDNLIRQKDLPAEILEESPLQPVSETMDFDNLVSEYKQELVAKALARSGGNKSQAAQILGISRNYLHQLLNRQG